MAATPVSFEVRSRYILFRSSDPHGTRVRRSAGFEAVLHTATGAYNETHTPVRNSRRTYR